MRFQAVLTKIEKIGRERCKKAAYFIRDKHRELVGKPGPQHSRRGEYPRKQSGDGQRGVRAEFLNGVWVVIQSPHTWYMQFLKDRRGRKGIIDTVKKYSGRVRQIMKGKD